VDVGAAIGYYTLILARAVGPKGLVFAFEPKIERFEILKKNIELNGYTNVILENKAVLPLEIKPTFFNMKNQHGGIRLIKNFETKNDHLEPVITDVIDLDTYFIKKNNQNQISFIKIDVDGPELFVLQSSKSILNNKHLKILIEWDKNLSKKSDCDPNEIIDLLFKNGFKIYYPDYSNKKYFLVNKDELLKLESTDTINLLCKKD
jgi:FkbM family methyltransferase